MERYVNKIFSILFFSTLSSLVKKKISDSDKLPFLKELFQYKNVIKTPLPLTKFRIHKNTHFLVLTSYALLILLKYLTFKNNSLHFMVIYRKLSSKELMLLNCGVGEDSWESLGQQGDPTSPSKGDQSWVFTGRTDAEAVTPMLWPPDAKSWLIWKDPDVGKDWREEEKGMEEDEVVGWHHRLNGHEFG